MTVSEFIAEYSLSPETIDARACLERLLEDMAQGLEGKGNIPMLPSYLPLDIRPEPGVPCCVLDAGGTNLRVAKAQFDGRGRCVLSEPYKTAMPGTRGELSADAFYGELAGYVRDTGCPERVGFCFSYNVSIERELDGILDSWCKEVRVPDAPGKPVGASLRKAVGEACGSVRVLNDSTAALLGAHWADPKITVALILGTGINTCYVEQCREIPKIPGDLRGDSMIISTEIGEFRGIPKNRFEQAVIDASDEPALAHAEKQCAGAYLGDIICGAWQEAARQGILPPAFLRSATLPQISGYLAGLNSQIPEDPAAKEIAGVMLHRAAKIAAVLAAGTILRSCREGENCTMVIEGSQFRKLSGFGQCFQQELAEILAPRRIGITIAEVENSCLTGAALGAFAEIM